MKPTPTARPWMLKDDLDLTPGGSLAVVREQDNGKLLVVAQVWQADDSFVGRATQEPTSCANAALIIRAVNVEQKVRELVRVALEDDNERRKGDWWGELQHLAREIKAELEGENG